MKKYLTLALLSGFVLYSGNVLAAEGTGKASATILADLSIIEADGDGLEFGYILQSDGNVIVDTSGNRTGSATLVNGKTPKAGKFTISGNANNLIKIDVPTTIDLTNDGGAELEVSNVQVKIGDANSISAGDDLDGQLGADGKLIMNVGGTLTVASNTPEGVYNGTYTVTVNYQ